MPLAVQYFNGTDYQQFGLTTADITSSGIICNSFWAIKDSVDNCFIFCGSTTDFIPAKIIRIDKSGNKVVSSMLNVEGFGTNNTGYVGSTNANHTLFISRDESSLFINCSSSNADAQHLQSIPTNFSSGDITPVKAINGFNAIKFALYQDRYIWVASGTTVKIYDYNTKAELASLTVTAGNLITCGSDNTLYGVNESWFNNGISEYVYNPPVPPASTGVITRTAISAGLADDQIKQLLIDRFGDLIILTNTGTASTLLKYTTAGVQIGTTLDLGGAFYNLNTDKDGNYYYSNALGTYKITANTAQGQALTGAGTKIRGSGMVTYGNNLTGYNPAVFGSQ